MDPGGETKPTSPRSAPPEGTTHHSDPGLPANSNGAQPTFLPPDRRHTTDVDGEATHPGQSTEDIEPEAKRARVQQIQTLKRGPQIWNWPEPYWKRVDPARYQMPEKLVQRARVLGEAIREQIRQHGWRNILDIETTEDEKVLSEKTEEVMHPCDSVHFQHVGELKPPRKENATPNPKIVARLSETPSQQEQATLPEGLPCSNKSPVEYCMSDEFIEHLDRQAKLYFSSVKQLSQKEIIANGFQHMNEEAFLAFIRYVAEKDLFEGLDYKFGELLHHCFSFEEHKKVYCHYNFTIEMKKKDEELWTSSRYFAEAKLMHGVKYYFCSPLEVTDDGQCYSCTNQGVTELNHPSGGGYQKGHEGSGSHFGYAESSDDEECV